MYVWIFQYVDIVIVAAAKSRTTKPLFRRRFGYTTTTAETTTIPKISEPRGLASFGTDQELESSLVDKKIITTRFNHNTDIFSDGVAEAITTISKAPLPFSGSTTTLRNVKITTPDSEYYADDSIFPITRRSDTLSTSSSETMFIPIQSFSLFSIDLMQKITCSLYALLVQSELCVFNLQQL